MLAPSDETVKFAQGAKTDADWNAFRKKYRAEMKAPDAARTIALFALLSRDTDLAVGCYCADEAHCHRSVLRELLAEQGATIVGETSEARAGPGTEAQIRTGTQARTEAATEPAID